MTQYQNNLNNEECFECCISSEHKLLDLKLKETIQYKDLLFMFVKRDFTAQYKQTILGPLWAIIQPLLTTVVFTIVFGTIARLDTTDIATDAYIPAFLFYMAGNICWAYISSTIEVVSKSFINNYGIMGKVYYPRLISPLSSAFSRLISFGIQLSLFTVFIVFFLIKKSTDITITANILFVPLIILQMMVLSLGCGIIISSVTTKYKDLQMVVAFGLSLWQYASPIAYGLSLIQQKYLCLYMLNPVSPIITTFRYAVFGTGYFNSHYYLISWVISLLLLFIGLILFSKIERTFMDTI